MAVRLMSCMMWLGTMSRGAGSIVIAAALFHAHGFAHGNLYSRYSAVPDRFENPLAKRKADVLDRLLPR
jgi:hypothetical protein